MFADASTYTGTSSESLAIDEPPSGAATLGGLTCRFFGDFDFTVKVFPEAAVPVRLRELTADDESACDLPETSFCSATSTSNGIWIQVSAYADNALGPTNVALIRAAAQEAISRAKNWPAPVAAKRDARWWDTSSACHRLEEALQIPTRLGSTDFIEGAPTDITIDPLLEEAGTERWCQWFSYETGIGVYVELMPGAGATWDAIAARGVPIDVPGATAAVTFERFRGHVYLVATDGTNVVALNADESAAEIASIVFATLN